MTPASPRTPTRKRPPRGFAKGAILGALVVIPLISLGIWIASRLGVGDGAPSMIEIVRLTVGFAGLPALVTAGGVGRLAAQASLEGGRPRAVWVAARTLAIAGLGLIVVAAIPTAVVPSADLGWAALALLGLAAGAIAGVAIGLACGGEMPSLAELGMWPADGTMGRAMDAVVHRGRRRRRRPAAPASDRRDRT